MTIRRPFQPPKKDTTRINENITSLKVRLIDKDGEMQGVYGTKQAIEKAYEDGLDLVEISPNAEPPVCKILDYGKYKFEQQKKLSEAKKKQVTVNVKEIKLRPAIGDHDYQTKLKAARKFVEGGDKLKVTLRFRGREMAHMHLGMQVMNRMKTDMLDIAKVDMEAKTEGRQIMMVMSPDLAVAVKGRQDPVRPSEAAAKQEEKKSEE